MATKPILGMGLDAGSGDTRTVICLLENGRLRFLGFGRVSSHGWKRGLVADHNAISASMRESIREAERRAQVSVASAVLGMGGSTINGLNSRGIYEFGHPREIDQADVNRAVDRASRVVLPEDRMLLHLFAQDFSVDDRPGHRDPRGIIGSRLEAYVHLVTASVQEHYDLVGAANHAHLAVEDTVFEPLAAAYAAVLPEDRRQGLALVDIGLHSTDFIVYYDEAVILALSLLVCGDHFTRDLVKLLHVSYEDAEWIKQQHGCAASDLTSENSFVEIPSASGRGPHEASSRELSLILEARAKELFSLVQRALTRFAMEEDFMRVVLSGGGACLAGMCETAQRMLSCHAVHGLPVGIQDWPEELNDPAWTTAAGLAMYSARLKFRADSHRRNNGFFRRFWD